MDRSWRRDLRPARLARSPMKRGVHVILSQTTTFRHETFALPLSIEILSLALGGFATINPCEETRVPGRMVLKTQDPLFP
jgi:hypothetical protein